MRTIEEIRQLRLQQLLAQPEYPTNKALAQALRRSSAQVSQWKTRAAKTDGGQCNIDSESARHIERCTNKVKGWMDNDPAYDNHQQSTLAPPTSMGATVARWVDGLESDKRHRAFWIIHQMVFADEWPADGARHAVPASGAPSSAPSDTPAQPR
jgi:hypothetical protein